MPQKLTPPRGRRAQRARGQAVIWLLSTLAASAVVLYAVFSFGQLSVGKQRAVNGADAAALAGATAQARLLNLVAYTNRGMIANEVFLVQLVSVESWLQYIEKTAGNFGTVLDILSLIPPIAPFAKPAATALDKVSDVAGKARDIMKDDVIPPVIKALELAKTGLKVAQELIHGGGGLLAESAAKSVVEANRSTYAGRHDPGLAMADTGAVRAITFVANEKDWLNFSQLYSTKGSEREDAKHILENSRDNFSASRPGRDWLNFSFNAGVSTQGLIKQGGSRLEGYGRWETQDTLEFFVHENFCPKDCDTYVPLGWGRSNADKSGSKGNTWDPGRAAQSWAHSGGGTHDGWSGVPELYDIKNKAVAQREQLGLDFLVAVSRAGANDFSSQGLGMGSKIDSPLGSPDLDRKLEANQHTAFAKARVFFERPRRGLVNDFTAAPLWRPDHAKEYGSLYSPYWQARLRDLSLAEKGALITAMGLSPDKAIYTPGGQ